MTLASVSDLVIALRTYRLLDAEQQRKVDDRLQRRHSEARALAKDLLHRGWLTAYQINQLFLGRGPELLLGDYVLLERLGEGSMGSVFKARHRQSGRVVALKLVRKDRLAHPQVMARFRREMQALASLDHPNVVLADEVVQAGDTLFFTMECVEGTDLGKLVKQYGPLPVWQACDYVRQAALGLQHAHERGLVHRDIKPSNLIVTVRAGGDAPAAAGTGVVKVLDMGLARLAVPAEGEQGPALTKLQTVLGTPDYISPEQARDSRNVDIRADLYSLGCTFYFLLAGQPPFVGGTVVDKLLKHCSEEPPPVEEVRRERLTEARQAAGRPPPTASEVEVPPEVVAVVQHLMAKEPKQRYQTPAQVAGLLSALLPVDTHIPAPPPAPAGNGAAAPLAPPSDAEVVLEEQLKGSATSGFLSGDEYRRPTVPGLWLFLAVLGGVLFLLLLLLFLAWVAQHDTPPRYGTTRPAALARAGDWRGLTAPLQ